MHETPHLAPFQVTSAAFPAGRELLGGQLGTLDHFQVLAHACKGRQVGLEDESVIG